VTLVNLVTGTQIGDTFEQSGQGAYPAAQFADHDSRLVVTTSDVNDYNTGDYTTRVTVLDGHTGGLVGTTHVIDGETRGVTSADQTHVVITTSQGQGPQGNTHVLVIDASSGQLIGDVELSGTTFYGAKLNADGSRAVIITSGQITTEQTHLAVIDTATGAQVGNTIDQAGYGASDTQTERVGDRVVLLTHDYNETTRTETTLASVVDTNTGLQVGSTVTYVGHSYLQVTADDKRAFLTSGDYAANTTRVIVLDTETGQRIGTINAEGVGSAIYFFRNDTRAVLQTDDVTSTANYVTIIDTATGQQLGDTIEQPSYGYLWTTDDESKAMFIRSTTDSAGHDTSTIDIINLVDGHTIGNDVIVDGTVRYRIFNQDSSQVLLYSETENRTARFTLVDLNSGAQIGDTIIPDGTLASGSFESWRFTGDDRAMLVTSIYDAATQTTDVQVTVLNTATGVKVGQTLHQAGDVRSVQYTADGAYAVVTTADQNPLTDRHITHVSIIDTSTGLRVGDELTQAGYPPGFINSLSGPALTPDGKHAILGTSDFDEVAGTGTTTITTLDIPARVSRATDV
jgi:hypothetical protein